MASDTLTSVAPVHRFILLTDIAQSSRLAEQYRRTYLDALEQHNQLVERTVAEHGGKVYKQTGDGYLVLFETAGACLDAALALGEALGQLEPLAEDEPLLVRLALHAGELRPSGAEYFGPALNRISRICQVCNPGQVLLSNAVKAILPKALDGCGLRDLGLHHLRDLAEPEQLYQLDSERFSRHEFPPLSTLSNRPNNLVEQPNAFIGRQHELEDLAQQLLNSKRLVTITAPGGYGKSRLAAQLCANLLHRFERGCFMAYLAPVREVIDVPFAIGNALGYQFSGGRTPEQQLRDYLRAKELLLCLDNMEHLMDSAPLVAHLLAAAPKLKIIITSREPLRIQGEQVYVLEPLPLDACAGEYSEAELLFADRAALVNRGFTLTPENSPEVRHFCEHMSGIPLAIELAAAWMDSFTLAELHDELSDQLELEARTSDQEPRHQSLKASLDWSWNLLGEQQQEVLMRLSVFRGGFSSEAAGAVLDMKGMALRGVLAKLCDKSWLYSREVNGQTRFFLRDMLAHEYALAKLEGTGGSDESLFALALAAHAAYFSALVERIGPRLGGGTADGGAAQRDALQTWKLELENINEALDTAINQGNANWLLPIAKHFKRYFSQVGTSFDMQSCYEKLLTAKLSKGNPAVLLHVKLGLGMSQWRLGNQKNALELLAESHQLARQLGDSAGQADCKNSLALIHCEQGDYYRAADLHSQALALASEIGYRGGEARSLANLANVHHVQGDYARSAELQGQALTIYRELGDRWAESLSLANLGNTRYDQGNYLEAADLHNLALAIRREIGDRGGQGNSLGCLAVALFEQGDYVRAAELQSQALALERETGNRAGEAHCLCNLGLDYHLQGSSAAALELLNQSLAIRGEIGDRRGEAYSLDGLATVYHSLGDHIYSAQLRSRELLILQEIGAQTLLASSCAVSAATLAALGDYRPSSCALYGGLKQAAAFPRISAPEGQQALDDAHSRLMTAVASGEITAEQLAAWKSEGEALSLDELAGFVQTALDKASEAARADNIPAEA